VKEASVQSTTSSRRLTGLRQVLQEALVITVAGLAFAAAANRLSPRGLVLSRDYFPSAPQPALAASPAAGRSQTPKGTNQGPAATLEALAARLQLKGLRLAGSNEVWRLFRDPRFAQELVVFVDVRSDREYQEGHVPGAYQFDRYHPENYLPAVLPACETAEQIVVYCHGGDCEDSEFAANTLGDAGIPRANLLVYGGGFVEWAANGLPLEIGPRLSGVLRQAKK